MLSFLALQPGGQAGRDRLCGLLWSDRDEDHARASLRQSLLELRQAWGSSDQCLLLAGRDMVRLDLTHLTVDVIEVGTLLSDHLPGSAMRIAALWQGELLADLVAPDRAFDEWLAIERAQWNRVIGATLRAALHDAALRDSDNELEALSLALLRHDPTDERACRALIEMDLRHGESAAALRRFATLRDVLKRDLDLKPSAELEALIARVRRGPGQLAGGRRPASMLRPVRRLPRLAVTLRPPIGPPPIAAELDAVLQDELLLCLGRARHLTVIPMRQPANDGAEADYALHVTLRCDGRSGCVTLRLTQQPDGRMVIVERFMLPEADVHAAITIEVARIAFAVEHAIALSHPPADDAAPDAYALWLAGDRLSESFRAADLEAAVPLFRQAAEADPGFARPVAGLASIELTVPMVYPSDEPPDTRVERGLALAKQAVAIDPWDARAHVILAWAYLRQRHPAPARAEFDRALALNPQDPDVLIAAAEGLAHLGDPTPGVIHGERALRIHPAPPDYYRHYLAIAYSTAGAHERALACSLSGPALLPEQLAYRAFSYVSLGRRAEADDAIREFRRRIEASWAGPGPLSARAVFAWLSRIILTADDRQRAGIISALMPEPVS